jgi:hypothetical protein
MPNEVDATAPANIPPIMPIAPRRDIEVVASRWVDSSKRSSVKAPRSFCEVSCPPIGIRRIRAIEHHDQRLRRVIACLTGSAAVS